MSGAVITHGAATPDFLPGAPDLICSHTAFAITTASSLSWYAMISYRELYEVGQTAFAAGNTGSGPDLQTGRAEDSSR